MTDIIATTVQILGKVYQIKCPQNELDSLHKAVSLLEKKMKAYRESCDLISFDRIAIITALNAIHQLTVIENKKDDHLEIINKRLNDLQDKLELALTPQNQLQFEAETGD